jgi:hypothetical protein
MTGDRGGADGREPPGMTVASAVWAAVEVGAARIEVHEFARPRGEASVALVRLSDDLVRKSIRMQGVLTVDSPGRIRAIRMLEAGHGRAHRQAQRDLPVGGCVGIRRAVAGSYGDPPRCTSPSNSGPLMNLTCNGGVLG